MPVEVTLHRAAEELTRGDLASVLRARQRLAGLVGTYPNRLDLRDKLASVYRLLGDTAQAGRWSYLSEVRDDVELRAFEHAYKTPVARLTALNWTGGENAADTETARTRLVELHRAATAQVQDELVVAEAREPGRSWVTCALIALGLALLVVLVVTGAITAVRFGYRILVV
jgi:cytochrome c-type biogenesis protein CcmH/NrfG